MLKVYVNYPNPKLTVHQNPSCGAIQKMAKSGQRLVRIDAAAISAELQRFMGKGYTFAANPAENDMWLEVEFADAQFEAAVVAFVHRLIGGQYPPLARAIVHTHF
jgi:hypothetical protein